MKNILVAVIWNANMKNKWPKELLCSHNNDLVIRILKRSNGYSMNNAHPKWKYYRRSIDTGKNQSEIILFLYMCLDNKIYIYIFKYNRYSQQDRLLLQERPRHYTTSTLSSSTSPIFILSKDSFKKNDIHFFGFHLTRENNFYRRIITKQHKKR